MSAARTARTVALLAATATCSACGASAPAEEAPPPAAPTSAAVAPAAPVAQEAPPRRSMEVGGQLGSLDPDVVNAAFGSVAGGVQRCYTDRQRRVRSLSGDVTVFLRIGEDGAVRYGYVQDTTLGDHDAEMCILHALVEAHWPSPRGGEAEIKKSVGFDPPGNVRAPASWASDEIAPALVASNAKIRACRRRATGAFKATAYIVAGPPPPPSASASASHAAAGGKGSPRAARPRKAPARRPSGRGQSKPVGHVSTVGIAAPSADPADAEAVECLVDALKEITMPAPPPGGAAKVTFSL